MVDIDIRDISHRSKNDNHPFHRFLPSSKSNSACASEQTAQPKSGLIKIAAFGGICLPHPFPHTNDRPSRLLPTRPQASLLLFRHCICQTGSKWRRYLAIEANKSQSRLRSWSRLQHPLLPADSINRVWNLCTGSEAMTSRAQNADKFVQANVESWNRSSMYVRCPNCDKTHHHSFSGGYTARHRHVSHRDRTDHPSTRFDFLSTSKKSINRELFL